MARYTDHHPLDDHSDPWDNPRVVTSPPSARKTPWGLLIGTFLVVALCLGVSIPTIMAVSDNGKSQGEIMLPDKVSPSLPVKGTAKPKMNNAPKSIKDGQWLVGDDVKAGRYRTLGAVDGIVVMCAWTIYEREDGPATDGGLVDELDSPGRVTLRSGQVFHTTGCRPWILQPNKAEGGAVAGIDIDWTDATPKRVPAKGQTTYVVNKLPSAWPVKSAVNFVNKYTTSGVKYVKACPSKAWRCFTFKAGAVKGNKNASLGLTTWNWKTATIKIDTADSKRAGLTSAQRKWLLVHETGHAVYLKHRPSCATSMYNLRRCSNGKVPPVRFDASQKATMRTW